MICPKIVARLNLRSRGETTAESGILGRWQKLSAGTIKYLNIII